MAAQEKAHGVLDRGRKVTTDQETEPARAHGINDAERCPADMPSFDDAEFLVRAGYELIPLRGGSKARTRSPGGGMLSPECGRSP